MDLTIKCNPSDPLYLGWRELMGNASSDDPIRTYRHMANIVARANHSTIVDIEYIAQYAHKIHLRFESAAHKDWFVLRCM